MERYRSKGFQLIRVIDAIYIGPVMIIGGIFGKTLHPFIRASLVAIGICTIIFNAINFADTEKFNKQINQ